MAWLREPWEGPLAGVLSYEFAWELLDIRAMPALSRAPRMWVGRFERDGAVPPASSTVGALGPIAGRVTADAYRAAVRRCVEDIVNGELFEVNYTARFDSTWSGTARAFFDSAARHSSGESFGLLETPEFSVASMSPESFIAVRDGRVEARPIKGTRRRSDDAEADRAAGAELLVSAKDRAENVMIVDLMRNDLTRVCELGSVHVTDLCKLESFAGLHHLVSTVVGDLRDGLRPIDALLECFPAGSITGAPKLRAIEIAAEVEVGARGPYTGTMFVATPDALRSSVLIRTSTLYPGPAGFDVEYGAGGAVVAESDDEAEWLEALTKVGPLLRMHEQPEGV